MGTNLRVLVAGNHLILRGGLRALLQNTRDFQVVSECRLGPEAVVQACEFHPELALLDLTTTGDVGLQLVRSLAQEAPATGLAVITHWTDQAFVSSALAGGVRGAFAADTTPAELLQGLAIVASGKRYLTPSVAETALQGLVERINGVAGSTPLDVLSPRERDVLGRIAEGSTSAQIARELHISVHTVDTHRRKLMEKLNLHSLASVIRFAMQHGLASPRHEESPTRR